MRPELQAFLDGEIERHELPVDLRQQAERWERLLAEMKAMGASGAPAELEAGVLHALPARARGSGLKHVVNWAVRPRSIRVSPLAGLAAAAAIAFLLVWPLSRSGPEPSRDAEATVYVQFVLEAPQATSVAIAGDFNGWQPEVHLEDPDGDGVWIGRVPMRPGVHHYMFVVDGSDWTTDPNADRYTDDGFGNRNAVLVVPQPTSKS